MYKSVLLVFTYLTLRYVSSHAQSMDQERCIPCDKGYYSEEGASQCQPCPGNHYGPFVGMAKCLVCPKGFVGTKEGSISVDTCTECQPHEIPDTYAGTCVACPHNTYPGDHGRCVPCPPGSVRIRSSTSECQPCEPGHQPKVTLSGESGNMQQDYRGQVKQTSSGIPCQNWLENEPHSHNTENLPWLVPDAGLGDHNYCRYVEVFSKF